MINIDKDFVSEIFEATFLGEIHKENVKKDILTTLDYIVGLENRLIISNEEIEDICELIMNDLKARISQDPISINEEYIYNYSRSFKVIFYYRIAHFLFNFSTTNLKYQYWAFQLSEYATSKCAIEIHPQAKIGKNFVIDHGTNSLIGATSTIGDNCTIMNNVLLGSRNITNNKAGKRHPTLGNNVQVASGAKLLGPIHIGDNTVIYPDCTISEDIHENSIVKLEYKCQVVKKGKLFI